MPFYQLVLVLNPFEKSMERPGNSLAYHPPLPVSLFFKIAINTRDVDLRFGFKLYAVTFLFYDSEVELRLFKVLLRQIVRRTMDMNWDFV